MLIEDETANEGDAKDDVRGYGATPFNISSSLTMENMGNPTLNIERSRNDVFLEWLRTWITTNTMSIIMIGIVG